MDIQKRFLHDRAVLLLITLMAFLLVIGVSLILWRFDVSKNPTIIVSYKPNVSASNYVSGKPIDIYAIAIFMVFSAVVSVATAWRAYTIRRYVAVFILASTIFLLILATIVGNSLISLQ
ncbi:MAG: hypothetical protein WD877_00005 [Candidatus Saccharimonadales bacterium]